MNLEAGRLETDRFLTAQRDLTAARNAFVSASVDYTLARLRLFQDLELLTVDEQGLTIDWDSIAQAAVPQEDARDNQQEDGE